MPSKPPRLRQWRGRWHVIFTDPLTRKERRVSCGERTATERREQLTFYRRQVSEHESEAMRLGGMFDYGRLLPAALADYLKDVDAREAVRHATSSREGLSYNSARQIRQVIADFLQWLPPHTSTGRLDATMLQTYFRQVATTRSSARANVYRRTLRAALVWLSHIRPRLFPDFDSLRTAFRQAHVEPRRAVAFTPTELQTFIARLPADQRPVFRFLALTGCRLGEIDDARLDGTRVRILSAKTGRVRLVPLTGAPECEVAPGLLRELRKGMPGSWDRRSWERAGDVRPQQLRRNFTSYAASMGVPATVCALWQGHSVQVAERYYAQQVLERGRAKSVEAAMGL